MHGVYERILAVEEGAPMTSKEITRLLALRRKASGSAKGALTKKLYRISDELCTEHLKKSLKGGCRGCRLLDELFDYGFMKP